MMWLTSTHFDFSSASAISPVYRHTLYYYAMIIKASIQYSHISSIDDYYSRKQESKQAFAYNS